MFIATLAADDSTGKAMFLRTFEGDSEEQAISQAKFYLEQNSENIKHQNNRTMPYNLRIILSEVSKTIRATPQAFNYEVV